MPNAATSTFVSLGDEFCWHARNFAAMYGAQHVDTIHILLAAAEVTPVELHGCHELNAVSISESLATLQIANRSKVFTEPLPKKLTHQAQELVAKATSFASRTDRAPTLRDIWVALSQWEYEVAPALERLGIDRGKLYRRVSGS